MSRLSFFVSISLLLGLLVFVASGCSDDEENPTGSGGDGVSSISGVVSIVTEPEILSINWALTQPSGEVLQGNGNAYLENMPTGNYQISWAEMPGWTAPAPNPNGKVMTSTGTVAFGGTYTPRPGVLIIMTNPANIPANWTLFLPDGSEISSQGDTTLTEQALGNYRIIWDVLDGWASPAVPDTLDQTLEAIDLGLLFPGSYAQADDFFAVNPLPAKLDAGWQITGPGGYTESGVGAGSVGFTAEGDYTISWSELNGYTAPDAETIAVVDSTSYQLTGTYTQITGSVSIDASLGANDMDWQLTGPQGLSFSGNGDKELSGMLAGTYTIHWPEMDIWTSPDDASEDLDVGGSIAFAASHTPALNIVPEPANLLAPWQVTGPGGFDQSGTGSAKLEELDNGQYNLVWQAVDGWATPDAVSGTIAADQGLVLGGTYVQAGPSLFITSEPADLAASWSLAGPDGFSLSGTGQEVVQVVNFGLYRLSWEAVDGYMTPGLVDFGVFEDEFKTLTGTYLPALEMVLLDGDSFNMGSPQAEYCRNFDEPLHSVSLSYDFSVLSTEVTNAQYRDLANWALDNGYATLTDNGVYDALDNSVAMLLVMSNGNQDIYVENGRLACANPDYPVMNVTWYGAVSYCDWLSMLLGYPRAYNHTTWQCNEFDPYGALGFRLPTEAEWEYAARAGTATAYANGDISFQCSSSTLELIGWYSDNSEAWVHPVAQLDPNDWGLYDMHGNLAEWTNEWYQFGYYYEGANTNPPGPSYSEEKVIRGGFFFNDARSCRSADRDKSLPASGSFAVGFRIVRSGS